MYPVLFNIFLQKIRRASARSVNQRQVYNTTLLNDKTNQNEFRITLNNRSKKQLHLHANKFGAQRRTPTKTGSIDRG